MTPTKVIQVYRVISWPLRAALTTTAAVGIVTGLSLLLLAGLLAAGGGDVEG